MGMQDINKAIRFLRLSLATLRIAQDERPSRIMVTLTYQVVLAMQQIEYREKAYRLSALVDRPEN